MYQRMEYSWADSAVKVMGTAKRVVPPMEESNAKR